MKLDLVGSDRRQRAVVLTCAVAIALVSGCATTTVHTNPSPAANGAAQHSDQSQGGAWGPKAAGVPVKVELSSNTADEGGSVNATFTWDFGGSQPSGDAGEPVNLEIRYTDRADWVNPPTAVWVNSSPQRDSSGHWIRSYKLSLSLAKRTDLNRDRDVHVIASVTTRPGEASAAPLHIRH
ncbi:MAG: hypothetical protein U0572_00600 [Phycisphaerales bacterium]